jgi:hypothetical protein
MSLLDLLHAEAMARGIIEPTAKIDAALAFALVRDMPYLRASSREPQTIIREWRGTCSGKHYLLQALFAELGLRAQVVACTTEIHIDPEEAPIALRAILQRSGGRIVDVHNYLVLKLPAGDMIVDATWPTSAKDWGLTANESFTLGENQSIACTPLKTWLVPDGHDPQEFKEALLRKNFSPEELAHRDEFIRTLGLLLRQRQ